MSTVIVASRHAIACFFPLLELHDIVLVKKKPGVVKPGGLRSIEHCYRCQSPGTLTK